MDTNVRSGVDEMITRDTWTAEDYRALLKGLLQTGRAAEKARALLGQLEADTPQLKGAGALKVGILRYILCNFNEAQKAFSSATDNADRSYFQGLCCKQLRRYPQALEFFQRAKDQGGKTTELDVEIAEVQALSGNLEAAAKSLARLEKNIANTADYFYLKGLIDELSGNTLAAGEAYVRAHEISPEHVAATFRLAYFYDLHGQEEEAVELYRRCISKPPVHASALMNLAVLYEDAGLNDQAETCLRSVLATNPNHWRARLFLKDVEASEDMFYDEDQAKRIAKRNAVLDIPVTDFELSVRARNCLKKMNIRTLGDLVRTTEPELLSYKNFGETSLREIKEMLTAKGLHLGQALEEEGEYGEIDLGKPSEAEPENAGILMTPLSQIEFSVRARRALEGLEIRTLGDLAAKSEAELLNQRNFGQTSMNEVRQRLAEYGLELRNSH